MARDRDSKASEQPFHPFSEIVKSFRDSRWAYGMERAGTDQKEFLKKPYQKRRYEMLEELQRASELLDSGKMTFDVYIKHLFAAKIEFMTDPVHRTGPITGYSPKDDRWFTTTIKDPKHKFANTLGNAFTQIQKVISNLKKANRGAEAASAETAYARGNLAVQEAVGFAMDKRIKSDEERAQKARECRQRYEAQNPPIERESRIFRASEAKTSAEVGAGAGAIAEAAADRNSDAYNELISAISNAVTSSILTVEEWENVEKISTLEHPAEKLFYLSKIIEKINSLATPSENKEIKDTQAAIQNYIQKDDSISKFLSLKIESTDSPKFHPTQLKKSITLFGPSPINDIISTYNLYNKKNNDQEKLALALSLMDKIKKYIETNKQHTNVEPLRKLQEELKSDINTIIKKDMINSFLPKGEAAEISIRPSGPGAGAGAGPGPETPRPRTPSG